jgi:hypothetical protein
MAFDAIYTSVATKLATVAPSTDNPRKLSDDAATANVTPPRYVWDPQNIREDFKHPLAGGNINPKAYGVDAHLWNIACWGATRADCERMRLALITALHGQLLGRNFALGVSSWDYEAWSRIGFVLVVQVTFFTAQVSVEIPDASAANQIPETDVNDAVEETVTITSVTPHDNTGAIAGDGIMQGGEG